MRPTALSLTLFLAAVAAAGCGHSLKSVPPVRLEWRGVSGKAAYRDTLLRALQSKRLRLDPCVDARPDKDVIGRFEQDRGGDVITNDDVPAYCTRTLRDRTSELGIQWVESAPEFTLRPELQGYFVTEGDKFNGRVTMRFTLVRADGSEAWAQTLEGKSSTWGGTHNPENYTEALNIAFDGVTKDLLSNRDLEAALQGQPPPPPEPLPPPPPPPLPKGPTLKLQWRGVDVKLPGGSEATLGALRATTIRLLPLIDTRTEPRAIGRYDNDKGKIVYTPDDVAAFYGAILVERLKTQGVKLLAVGAAFDVAPEIAELIVVEGNDFVAVARLRFTVSRNGKTIWTGVGEGHGKRWGKTHKAENLNEALSVAVDAAVRSLLSNPELAAALKP